MAIGASYASRRGTRAGSSTPWLGDLQRRNIGDGLLDLLVEREQGLVLGEDLVRQRLDCGQAFVGVDLGRLEVERFADRRAGGERGGTRDLFVDRIVGQQLGGLLELDEFERILRSDCGGRGCCTACSLASEPVCFSAACQALVSAMILASFVATPGTAWPGDSIVRN
ncbi:MAG: hypothetical protein ABIO45_07785 [Burkholderiaceae bacterium]